LGALFAASRDDQQSLGVAGSRDTRFDSAYALVTQSLQRLAHRTLTGPVVAGKGPDRARLGRLIQRFPAVPAGLFAIGILPERVPAFARRPRG
jgi:hypothetical protein